MKWLQRGRMSPWFCSSVKLCFRSLDIPTNQAVGMEALGSASFAKASEVYSSTYPNCVEETINACYGHHQHSLAFSLSLPELLGAQVLILPYRRELVHPKAWLASLRSVY
jgi:hypothetical protein